jgi:hypothetical protein
LAEPGQLDGAAGSPATILTGGRVRDVDYLDGNGAFTSFRGLAAAPAIRSADGSTVVVVLSADAHRPAVNFRVPDSIGFEATSMARRG